MNIPSYAFSLVESAHEYSKMPKGVLNFDVAAKVAKDVFLKTKDIPFPKHTLLNVNIPNRKDLKEIGPIEVCRQGMRYYSNEVTKRTDPRGKDYYWIGGAYSGFEQTPDSDCTALEAGKVSIVPITIDCTHNDFYATLSKDLKA